MFTKSVLKYILFNYNFFFLSSPLFFKNDVIIFCKSTTIRLLSIYLKFSFFFKNSMLLDLFAFEVPLLYNKLGFYFKHIVSYLFLVNDIKLILFSFINKFNTFSIEFIFRNAKWLEREVSDFFNIFFKYKKDRRTLFTIPLLFNHVLEKKYPMTGFYELFVCAILKKLKYKHISNLT
jgi:NADH:ubiquinone oxidoreductase subunit C